MRLLHLPQGYQQQCPHRPPASPAPFGRRTGLHTSSEVGQQLRTSGAVAGRGGSASGGLPGSSAPTPRAGSHARQAFTPSEPPRRAA